LSILWHEKRIMRRVAEAELAGGSKLIGLGPSTKSIRQPMQGFPAYTSTEQHMMRTMIRLLRAKSVMGAHRRSIAARTNIAPKLAGEAITRARSRGHRFLPLKIFGTYAHQDDLPHTSRNHTLLVCHLLVALCRMYPPRLAVMHSEIFNGCFSVVVSSLRRNTVPALPRHLSALCWRAIRRPDGDDFQHTGDF
jgi:hypothetical protein